MEKKMVTGMPAAAALIASIRQDVVRMSKNPVIQAIPLPNEAPKYRHVNQQGEREMKRRQKQMKKANGNV